MSAVPTITMNDGRTIPQLGFGVFKIQPENTAKAVGVALDVGYRHIDTAEMYGNEKEVGQAVRASGLARSEVFVTSKLNNGFHRPDDARAAFAGTLADLGLDYVDLFLIHWPLRTLYDGDFVSTWRVLEEFARDDQARSIGVSNFQDSHLRRLETGAETVPAVNQIEAHPYFTNDASGATAAHAASRPRRGRPLREARCSTIRSYGMWRRGWAGRLLKWFCAGIFSGVTSCSPNRRRRRASRRTSNCSTLS